MDDERSNEMSNSIMPLPQAMERRTFLGGLTAASFGVLLQNAFAEPVRSQMSTTTGGNMARQDSFETSEVKSQETPSSSADTGRGRAF
jgi:hypothetical protein